MQGVCSSSEKNGCFNKDVIHASNKEKVVKLESFTNINLFKEPTPIRTGIIHKLDMEMHNLLLVISLSFRPIKEKRDSIRLK